MSLKDTNSPPPKKKSKALLVILILVGLFILSIPVLGIFAAIAVPALATAKQEAQIALAQSVVNNLEETLKHYEQVAGKNATSWQDINDLILIGGKSPESPEQLLARMPKGSKLEIRGIDGKRETSIEFPNGKVITPKTNSMNN